MAEFISGPTMILSWVWSGGTISLAGDYRTCNWAPSVDYADTSAGADTQKGKLPTLKDAKASITMVGQAAGTLMVAALAPGNGGTLTIGPEGTATGKRKITFPSYCDGATFDFPYADVVTISVAFTGSSALNNYTDGAY